VPTELSVEVAEDEEAAERDPVGNGDPVAHVDALVLTAPPDPDPVE
jgi:hypothetical protein